MRTGSGQLGRRLSWFARFGMVAGLLPMVMGGDAGGLKLASALAEFIKAPKSLTISLKGRGGPVRIMDLQQVTDPGELIKKIEIDATANK